MGSVFKIGESLFSVVEFVSKTDNDVCNYIPGEKRFAVMNAGGEIIDDAQGFGYKTASAAMKCAYFKFGDGKKKLSEGKQWIRKNPEAKKLFTEIVEMNFKEIARSEFTMNEVFAEIEKTLGIVVPKNARKILSR